MFLWYPKLAASWNTIGGSKSTSRRRQHSSLSALEAVGLGFSCGARSSSGIRRRSWCAKHLGDPQDLESPGEDRMVLI